MKYILLFTVLLSSRLNCFAQETSKKTEKLTDSVTEHFFVLKSDGVTRHGLYQAIYRKNIAVASGQYTNGKRTGTWHFYDKRGNLLENYDYDHNEFLYEAPEDTTSPMRYKVDRLLSETDKTRKPYHPGGRYYGYLPFIAAYKVPLYDFGFSDDVIDLLINRHLISANIELLVSQGGRLADFKVRIISPQFQIDYTTNFDPNLFSEYDRKFIPATVNGEPVLCRITISCRVQKNGKLDFKD